MCVCACACACVRVPVCGRVCIPMCVQTIGPCPCICVLCRCISARNKDQK